MGRVGTWALVLVIVVVGALLWSRTAPLRDLYNSLFNAQTSVATGDVVLQRLQEQKTLVAATGTFEVPVVVCDGRPEAYDLRGAPDEEDRTPAQQLLDACSGPLDDKATLLARADVDAIIDLAKLTSDDIDVEGTRVAVTLPAVELAEPRIDAEGGMSVIGIDKSIPFFGGDLPEDYQARAAGAAKDAIADVAGGSDLARTGGRSAQSLFTSLLGALGFTEVAVTVEGPVAD